MEAPGGAVTGCEAEAAALCEVGRLFGERLWCLATAGNFSLRVDDSRCLITRSGTDKARLAVTDLMICDFDGIPVAPGARPSPGTALRGSPKTALRPSAETAVHACLYALDDGIGAVLHIHSVASTVASRHARGDLVLHGFEMQKAIAGVTTHEDKLVLPVLENTQDMRALAATVRQRYALGHLRASGFLVRGHGLYAWGADLPAAKRHVEGLEFLLSCLLEERKLGR